MARRKYARKPKRSRNPKFSELKKTARSVFRAAKKAGAKKLAQIKARKRRHVELDGKVTPAGSARMAVIAKVREATGAKHGDVRWNPKRTGASGAKKKRKKNPHVFPSGRKLKVENFARLASAQKIARKAAAAKRAGKPYHGDRTATGRRRTPQSAMAYIHGFRANTKSPLGGRKDQGILWEDHLASMGAY